MTSNDRTPASRRLPQQLASVGLGVFICWQLFYLVVANVKETSNVIFPEQTKEILGTDAESKTPLQHSLNRVMAPTLWWEEAAEQPQRWSLFGPDINDQTTFLACEFRWDDDEDAVAWLYSADEPLDTTCYFRVGRNRVRSVEQNLALTFAMYHGESEQSARERWHYQIKRKVAYEHGGLITWANHRLHELRIENPDIELPDEVLIHLRGFELAPPTANSRDAGDPYAIPLARWRPSFSYPADALPIESFNPVSNQFELQSWNEEIE